MKKNTLLITITLIILFAIFNRNVYAQTFDFSKAYQDYQYNQSIYNQSFNDYQEAKGFYLKNPTLTLKEEARKKALLMLKNRDELIRVYLTALRMKIFENKGLSENNKNDIFEKIDTEISWIVNHKASFMDTDTLEILFEKSKESENRYKDKTLPVIYESLFYSSLGAEQKMRSDQEQIYNILRSIIDQDVSKGKYDINPFNRWFTDIEDVIQKIKQNEILSQSNIKKLYDQNHIDPTNIFNTSIDPLNSILGLLSQLNRFLLELLTSIKNQTND